MKKTIIARARALLPHFQLLSWSSSDDVHEDAEGYSLTIWWGRLLVELAFAIARRPNRWLS